MLKVGPSIPLERLRGLWRSRPISSLFLWQYWQYRGGDFWIIKQYRYIFRHMIPPAPPDLLISARLPEWARENACDTVILMFCTRNTEDNLTDFHRTLKKIYIYIYLFFVMTNWGIDRVASLRTQSRLTCTQANTQTYIFTYTHTCMETHVHEHVNGHTNANICLAAVRCRAMASVGLRASLRNKDVSGERNATLGFFAPWFRSLWRPSVCKTQLVQMGLQHTFLWHGALNYFYIVTNFILAHYPDLLRPPAMDRIA